MGEIFFAIIFAGLLTTVFVYVFKNTGPWGSMAIFFTVLFLGVWAAALWLKPAGPLMWGIAWIPMLCAGLVLALMLASAAPVQTSRLVTETEEVKREEKVMRGTGVFLWLLFAGLILLILIRYLF